MLTPTTPRFALPLLVAGQGQKEVTLNEALAALDGLVGARAESRSLAAPPADPQPGNAWIVPPGAIGAWVGQAGRLALASDGGWRFFDLPPGARVELADEARTLTRLPDGWRAELKAPAEPPTLALPTGGSTIDQEARAVLASLVLALRQTGILA